MSKEGRNRWRGLFINRPDSALETRRSHGAMGGAFWRKRGGNSPWHVSSRVLEKLRASVGKERSRKPAHEELV